MGYVKLWLIQQNQFSLPNKVLLKNILVYEWTIHKCYSAAAPVLILRAHNVPQTLMWPIYVFQQERNSFSVSVIFHGSSKKKTPRVTAHVALAALVPSRCSLPRPSENHTHVRVDATAIQSCASSESYPGSSLEGLNASWSVCVLRLGCICVDEIIWHYFLQG